MCPVRHPDLHFVVEEQDYLDIEEGICLFSNSCSPLYFVAYKRKTFFKGVITLFCHCLCFCLIFSSSFLNLWLNKENILIKKNTSYKDYIEAIYLKGLFKKKMETTTFHITTLNVLFWYRLWFILLLQEPIPLVCVLTVSWKIKAFICGKKKKLLSILCSFTIYRVCLWIICIHFAGSSEVGKGKWNVSRMSTPPMNAAVPKFCNAEEKMSHCFC